MNQNVSLENSQIYKPDLNSRIMKKILITGASGFLGVHLIEAILLETEDFRIRCIFQLTVLTILSFLL